MFNYNRRWIQGSKIFLACSCISVLAATPTLAAEGLEAHAHALNAPVKPVAKAPTAAAKPEAKKPKAAPKAVDTNADAATKRYKDLNSPAPEKATPDKSTPKKHKRAPSTGLVPPPPPSIPTFINGPPTGFEVGPGFSVQYMSLDDLRFQQKATEKKLEAAKADEVDQKSYASETDDRAKRFVALFEEGVVSRRELETSKQDAERAARDLDQSHLKVSELDRTLGQIKQRIQTLEATKKPPVKLSSKKSRNSRR